MGWDIDVREKVYQRLANEIFFRILRGGVCAGGQAALIQRDCKRGWEQPGNPPKSIPGTTTAWRD